MNFKPHTEQELADMRLWAKGIYDFEVSEAFEKPSKSSGRPMIELKVKLFKPDGSSRIISDYLVEQRAEKLRHAAEACGLLDKYMKGSLTNVDFQHKRGKLKLGIEKDRSHTYPDKNVVVDYISASSKSTDGTRGEIFTL